MVFSSIPFLYYFLPCALLLYFLVPRKLKNTSLLITSLFFYAWGEPKFALVMVFTIFQGYIFSILIEKSDGKKAKMFMAISAVISLGLLGYCKYADFFIYNFNAITGLSIPLLKITLPVGISFYTFQILSYTIDVYRKDVPAQRNFINLAAYIAMFPQLIAGPIVRFSDIAYQLENRTHSIDKVSLGVQRFVLGLAKKVLIANTLGELCSIFKATNEASVLFFWLYAVSFMLHLYFDFSGYSDMAIGLGKMMGFDFLENFNYPYISRSVSEFWRRWHMSLGSWFRDYVYIPLGGNRVKKSRRIFNVFVVWLLTGFWHGAAWNFVLWGLVFALLIMAETLFIGEKLKKTKVICHIYTLLLIAVSFVIFDAASITEAWLCIKAMFGFGGFPLVSAEAIYYLRSYGLLLTVGIIGATPAVKCVALKISDNPFGEKIMNVLEPVVLVVLLLVVTAFIVDGSFNPFLYFRF